MGLKIGEIIPREDIQFEKLKDKTIAIDSFNMMFQFLSSIRQQDGTPLMDNNGQITSHLVGIFSRIPNLMQKGLKLCFVYDGESPIEKEAELKRRTKIKEEAKEKYFAAKEKGIKEDMLKYSRMFSSLDSAMIRESKELLSALGLPVIQAPSEAEAQAAYMCQKKDVWAVATQDYDALLFKSPRLIQNLTLSTKKRLPNGQYSSISPRLIRLSEVLNTLQIDHDQFIIFSILVGTDFNVGGVKGIGPKRALDLVRSDRKFEEIFNSLDTNFDWKHIYDLIKNIPTTDDYDLSFGEIDPEKIIQILVDKHNFSDERVQQTLKRLTEPKEQKTLNKWF